MDQDTDLIDFLDASQLYLDMIDSACYPVKRTVPEIRKVENPQSRRRLTRSKILEEEARRRFICESIKTISHHEVHETREVIINLLLIPLWALRAL